MTLPTDDELLAIASETAGAHWFDHAHVLRFARAAIAAHAGNIAAVPAQPVAWLGGDGHPHHISAVQTITERHIYGPWQPLYAAPQAVPVPSTSKWAIEYQNETGPDDGGFWEWWEVSDGEQTFKADTEADAKMLLALLSAQAVPVPAWQPIETAPRGSGEDGPEMVNDPDYVAPPQLLLMTPDGMTVGAYDWYYHAGYGRGAEPGVPAWRQSLSSEPIYDATHWMPLPAAPKEQL